MVYATKEQIVAAKHFSTERYIRSTHPVLYISGRSDFQGVNQFRSDDAYGRLCTRTGALWTPQGYKFDGTDDDITVTLSLSPPYTLLVWVNQTNTPANYGIFDGNTGVSALLFQGFGDGKIHFNNGTQIDGDAVTAGFHLYTVVVNGASSSITTDLAAPGTGSLSTTSITSIILGRRNDATQWRLGGIIGEVLVYSRALTVGEIRRNYQVTRFRYQ